jgi:hypothetical protein
MVGLPLLVFFNLITGGLVGWLLVGAVILTVLGLFNYLLWGRSLNRQVAGEREEEELRARAEAELWPYDEPPDRPS